LEGGRRAAEKIDRRHLAAGTGTSYSERLAKRLELAENFVLSTRLIIFHLKK
jgi:hypothetical protein